MTLLCHYCVWSDILIKCINCSSSCCSLQSFMYGDYIAFDFWLGKVYDLTNHIILKLSNGARYAVCVLLIIQRELRPCCSLFVSAHWRTFTCQIQWMSGSRPLCFPAGARWVWRTVPSFTTSAHMSVIRYVAIRSRLSPRARPPWTEQLLDRGQLPL